MRLSGTSTTARREQLKAAPADPCGERGMF
jgi:hypothetical protein